MSWRKYFICDGCGKEFDHSNGGGKHPTWVPAVHYVKDVHIRLQQDDGDYDFCSPTCLKEWY